MVIPQIELSPPQVALRLGKVDGGAGKAFYFGPNAGRLIGQTNQPKRCGDIAIDHAVQSIDIVGSVGGAPIHANDLFHN